MNEELLNQLLQKFQELINNINDSLNSQIERIQSVNEALRALQNNDLPLNLDNVDLSQSTESIRRIVDGVREVSRRLRTSSGQLGGNFDTLASLLNELTNLAQSDTRLTSSLSKVIETLKQLQQLNVETPQQTIEPPQTQTGNSNGGNDDFTTPEFGEEFNGIPELLQPQTNISTVSLPYQDIANALRNSLLRPIDKLNDVVNKAGLTFEQITGGLNRNQLSTIQEQTLPSTLESILNALSRYASRLYEKGSAVDRSINMAFAQEVIRPILGSLSQETPNY